jgi:hypothetical protein
MVEPDEPESAVEQAVARVVDHRVDQRIRRARDHERQEEDDAEDPPSRGPLRKDDPRRAPEWHLDEHSGRRIDRGVLGGLPERRVAE